jgi:hypothetical protein
VPCSLQRPADGDDVAAVRHPPGAARAGWEVIPP